MAREHTLYLVTTSDNLAAIVAQIATKIPAEFKHITDLTEIEQDGVVISDNRDLITKWRLSPQFPLIWCKKVGDAVVEKEQLTTLHQPISITQLFRSIQLLCNQPPLITIGEWRLDPIKKILSLPSVSDDSLQLTSIEAALIHYIAIQGPVSTKALQQEVLGYKKNIESHTVASHIYRLRNKISEQFWGRKLITTTKGGYILDT